MTSPGDGIFNIDKEPGITSMEVVRQVKRQCSQRHVGHGGTLDPEATGVLPVCLGQATRLMQFLVDSNKDYLATIRLGITTDTYDAQGRIVEEQDPSGVTPESFEAALRSLRGTIQQTPPMYSALKHQGHRLHQLARAGIQVERAPRTVEVTRLELVRWEPPLATLSIHCSRGVYIRSLAYDLGQLLGCGAHLAQLRRLRTGPFHVDQAVSIERLREALQSDSWTPLFHPPDYVVLRLSAVLLNAAEERQIRNGRAVPLSPRTHYTQHMEACRAYADDGRFVALVRFNRMLKLWQPFKVFQLNTPSPYKLDKALI
ncbi:tRNA pseudouridine(55) synthase TruB [Chloroflexota bacterium]